VIIEKTMNRTYLSNTYLVADKPGGHAVLIDTGGPTGPILKKIEELRLDVSHVLCTHHHIDHVSNNAEYKSRFGCPICGHAKENEMFGGLDVKLTDGDELTTGGLHVRAVHVPGHTLGQLAFMINDERIFTGDTLFRRTVGGTRAPGHTSFEDIRYSIMEVLMRLPVGAQPVHPVVARPGPGGRQALHRLRRAGRVVARGHGLRRWDQVLGPLRRGQQAGHRSRLAGPCPLTERGQVSS
jgi:glyoxylase-like metal-dependent hydrolase (beta-lactamase superfamily II)